MTKEQRLIIAEKYVSLFPEYSKEHLLFGALMEELTYAQYKCGCHPDLDYIQEYEKVIEAYTFEDLVIPDSVFNYKKFLLSQGKPKWFNAGHYDINDSVSYIGEYYDGTPTSKYRKKGRFIVKPLCPEFLSSESSCE